MMKIFITAGFLLMCIISQSAGVFNLKTDLRSNHLGIDNPATRFNRIIESEERGFQQTGKVSSNSTFEVM